MTRLVISFAPTTSGWRHCLRKNSVCMSLQNELRKAALEREGADSRKAVLPGKDGDKEAHVVDIDHLTQTQVCQRPSLFFSCKVLTQYAVRISCLSKQISFF